MFANGYALARVVQFSTGCAVGKIVQFSMGRAVGTSLSRAIYHTEVYTEVCAGAIYPKNGIKSQAIEDSLYQKKLYESLAKAKPTEDKYRGRGYDRGQEAEQKQVKIMEDRRDKEVNMAAGNSDDALVCCVENTVEDRIMHSDASFHATYCKEEIERFKLRSCKVRLADDMSLDIAGVGDVVLKTYFGTSWTLKDVSGSAAAYHQRLCDMSKIGMSMLASKGNVPDVRKVDIYFCKPGGLGKQKNLSFTMLVKTRKLQTLEQVHIEGYGPTFISSI
ncbi:hypothetical protein Tco_1119439 [Tanacetum coccineum]